MRTDAAEWLKLRQPTHKKMEKLIYINLMVSKILKLTPGIRAYKLFIRSSHKRETNGSEWKKNAWLATKFIKKHCECGDGRDVEIAERGKGMAHPLMKRTERRCENNV